MKAFVVWNGLQEYMDALRQMPAECAGEAKHIVEGEVNAAYVTISAVYGAHRHTGTLQKRLTITNLKVGGQYTTGLKLTSGSPIAWLFDNGSQARHYTSANGVEHKTGAMWGKTPPTHIFTKTVAKGKRAVVDRIKTMMLRRGATAVTET